MQECALARERLEESLEVSRALTDESFAYRKALRLAYAAIVLRAAMATSLKKYGSFELGDLDLGDAYGKIERGTLPEQQKVLWPTWNWGPWARSFFGRQKVAPLTSEGFAPTYETTGGINQKAVIGPNGWTSFSALVKAMLRVTGRVTIKKRKVGVVDFSDDARPFDVFILGAVTMMQNLVMAYTVIGSLVNVTKLAFYLYGRGEKGRRVLRDVEVPKFGRNTKTEPSLMVGIPVAHDVKPSALIDFIEKSWQTNV